MNMVYITCNASVQEQIQEVLDKANIREYQIVDQVMAKTKVSSPRFNNPVWPGYNTVFFCLIKETEKVEKLMEILKNFNQDAFNSSELITVCAWPLQYYFFGENITPKDSVDEPVM